MRKQVDRYQFLHEQNARYFLNQPSGAIIILLNVMIDNKFGRPAVRLRIILYTNL